jgi:hypothetical protein
MHHKLISSRLIHKPPLPSISRSNSCSSEGSNTTTVAEDHVPLDFSLSVVVSRELGTEALMKEAEKHDEKIIQQQIQQAQASSIFSALWLHLILVRLSFPPLRLLAAETTHWQLWRIVNNSSNSTTFNNCSNCKHNIHNSIHMHKPAI